MRKHADGDRLSFIPPLMPTLVEPPEGDDWIHEVKFDGYRSQMLIDESGTRIITRRCLNWTSKYRDLAAAGGALGVESAVIDGEIIVLNDAGLSDFGELRKAITRRQHDLDFVAFDLLHLNDLDLRDMTLEERREILAGMNKPGGRIQFSEPLPGEARPSSICWTRLDLRGRCRSGAIANTQRLVDELAEGETLRDRRIQIAGRRARGRQAGLRPHGRSCDRQICRIGIHQLARRHPRPAVEARPGTRRAGAEGHEAAGDAMGQAGHHRPREALARGGRSAACIAAGFPGGELGSKLKGGDNCIANDSNLRQNFPSKRRRYGAG
jgi:hypothetical protein